MGYGSDGIRNNTGFRSYARKERYTIPAHDWANYVEVVESFTERLQGVVIENMDALTLIEKQDGSGTLFYIDPPYVHSTRSSKNPKQYRHEMSDEEHRDLAASLYSVEGRVVISGYDCELYAELYDGWHKEVRETFADGARQRTETLWMNFEPYPALF